MGKMSGFVLTVGLVLNAALLANGNIVQLRSYISEHGLHGHITFSQAPGQDVVLSTSLNVTLERPQQTWSWSIAEFPVDHTILEGRCQEALLGRTLVALDESLGLLVLPENSTGQTRTSLRLTGPDGIYGKSLVLESRETGRKICSTITWLDKSVEKSAVASFNTPISGTIGFRWILTKDNQQEMLITADLYHVRNVENISTTYSEHNWKIFVTDILDSENEQLEDNCNILQLVFDPENRGDGAAIGDVDSRLGRVKVPLDRTKNRFKTLYRDERLILLPSDLTGPHRRLYVVVYETKHPDSFLACAKIRYENPIFAKAIIQSGGIEGEITLSQHNRFEPTFLNFNLTTARGDVETRLVYTSSVSGYKIHELPIMPAKSIEQTENACLSTAFVYNPLKLDFNRLPPNGYGTQDQYPIGDLSGKLLGRNNATDIIQGSVELKGQYWDVFLPLSGRHSVIHRSIVIYKNTLYSTEMVTEPWICGSIALYEANQRFAKPILTAQAVFRYPVVGRIVFRQPKAEPWADTTILVETLIHADGAALNSSMGHRWAIHEQAHGQDFYNWSKRCESAGDVFNPHKVDVNEKKPSDRCDSNHVGLCRLGDLSTRLMPLDIAGQKLDNNKVSRKLFTDNLLPLSGRNKILGKSFVAYDDFGPKARGDRLACSIIEAIYRRKAVARDWYSNGNVLTLTGKIEFYQQTEFDITNIEVDLQGLHDTSGYHVHQTPVEGHLEFPCESTTLYDHWNPLNVDPKSSPRQYQGTPDQYEMGDLSGKFGTLDNFTLYKSVFNDTMLPLFGPRSIMGRSILIHKRVNNQRWVCASIERGYSPSEARELRAIASFHHPDGYAYGYIRMTQLVYNDGSKSDTIIEVKLRHPGVNDRNITRDHNWALFVNPVGVDAAVKIQDTRCVAGGYMWNPYYTQLADPLNNDLYRQECGPDNPLRCYAGDMSARLGTIDLGLKRIVLTDSNLPLEGPISAMGRSIVIFGPNRDHLRFACANIEPDYDIIKYANIQRPPKFVLAQFIADIRRVMGIPEWMLSVDSRQTKTLHSNACVQFLVHFKGPVANKLEQDFSRLLAVGRLDSPSLYIPGYINTKRKSKISYKPCGTRDPLDKGFRQMYRSSAKRTRIEHWLRLLLLLLPLTFIT